MKFVILEESVEVYLGRTGNNELVGEFRAKEENVDVIPKRNASNGVVN
jgi:hypothetical protein